jgi:hypothetical protein
MLLFFHALFLNAQVTIGLGEAPSSGALLQLKEKEVSDNSANATKGLELPRVELVNKNNLYPMFQANDPSYTGVSKTSEDKKHTGLTVYNITTDPNEGFEPGIYVWNGQEWTSSKNGSIRTSVEQKFFYMPSFNLPLNGTGTLGFDLYEEYKRQFTKNGNNAFISNNSTLTEIPGVYKKEDLDFVVTDYDNTVVNIKQILDSYLIYEVKSTQPSIHSFINIIIVVKKENGA